MNDNNHQFAVGELVTLKDYEEVVGVILQLYTFYLPHDKEIKCRIHWFKTGSDPFLYNEVDLIPI